MQKKQTETLYSLGNTDLLDYSQWCSCTKYSNLIGNYIVSKSHSQEPSVQEYLLVYTTMV